MWFASPGCLIVLVELVCIKGAFGVAFGDRTSSTLDTHQHDQGRTQLSRSRWEVRPTVQVIRTARQCLRWDLPPGVVDGCLGGGGRGAPSDR